jgi:hypothetical protein
LLTDPRLDVVENILTWRPGGDSLRDTARKILAALDDLHVHDARGNLGWDDETEPDA